MDAMLWEVQDVVNQKEEPGAQRVDVKTEELYVVDMLEWCQKRGLTECC